VHEVEVVRRFDAAPEAVWEVYTEHGRWSEWAGLGASRLEREGETHRNGTGAVRALGPSFLPAREEVLAFEPPRRMTYRIVSGGLPIRNHLGEVRIEPEGEGARLVWCCRFESKLPGLGGLFQRLITRLFRNALDGLSRTHFPDRA